jgi:hypothetical protein
LLSHPFHLGDSMPSAVDLAGLAPGGVRDLDHHVPHLRHFADDLLWSSRHPLRGALALHRLVHRNRRMSSSTVVAGAWWFIGKEIVMVALATGAVLGTYLCRLVDGEAPLYAAAGREGRAP